jgi:hypothetical protein
VFPVPARFHHCKWRCREHTCTITPLYMGFISVGSSPQSVAACSKGTAVWILIATARSLCKKVAATHTPSHTERDCWAPCLPCGVSPLFASLGDSEYQGCGRGWLWHVSPWNPIMEMQTSFQSLVSLHEGTAPCLEKCYPDNFSGGSETWKPSLFVWFTILPVTSPPIPAFMGRE